MDLGLSKKKALVTGGSKGIGRGVVAELLREGATVSFCARDQEEVAATADELGTLGEVYGHVVDVRDADEVTRFVDASAEQLGGIDILVNNAGGAHPGTFETLDDETILADYNIKVLSWMRLFRAALAHLRESESARVVNVGSVYAKGPDHNFFSTTVQRAAGLNLSKALAQEFAPEGILVNAVNIGCIVTPQWRNIHQKRRPELSEEEFFQAMSDEIPLGRFGTVEEVSAAVAFLASPRASYITGASLDIAGGMGRYV